MIKLQNKKVEEKNFCNFKKLKSQIYWPLILVLLNFSLFCPTSFAYKTNTLTSNTKHVGHFVFDTVPMNLEELVSSSNRIFSGVCTEIKEIENDPIARLPVVKYTFKITEGIRGVDDQYKISFKQWKPTTRDAGYEIGKKYLLFLHPNSGIGLTSPVGFLQGHFKVGFDDATRQEVVTNNFDNKGLSRNLRTQKKISIEGDKELSDYIENSSENGSVIGYKEFVKTIRYFIKK